MTKRLLFSLLAAIAGIATAPGWAEGTSNQGVKSPLDADFAKYVNNMLEEWHTAGIAIGIVDGDNVFTDAYGYAILPDTKARPETLWYVGSTTKAQLSATISQFISNKSYPALEQGWSTPISSIIYDDFVMQDEWATTHLTLEDATSHRSGLGNHDSTFFHERDGQKATVKALVRNIRNLPIVAPPRTTFIYCNYMFVTLSHVVETLTGEWLGTTLKRMLWQPLSMTSTYLSTKEAQLSKHTLSRGYSWDDEKQLLVEMPPNSVDEIEGAGAVISNVVDYTKWIRCLLNESAPLSKDVHKDIQTPRFIDDSLPTFGMSDVSLYGLGWWTNTFHGKRLHYHSGSTLAHGALVWWLPEINYGVVVFSNFPGPIRDLVMRKVVEDRLNIAQKDRFNLTGVLEKAAEDAARNLKNVTNILYPDCPDPPLPSPIDTKTLAGKYHDAAYGTLHFKEQEGDNGTELVAEMQEATFPYRVRLEHITGNYWIAYMYAIGPIPQPAEYSRASFEIGPDGKPTTLNIDAFTPDEAKRVFKRV